MKPVQPAQIVLPGKEYGAVSLAAQNGDLWEFEEPILSPKTHAPLVGWFSEFVWFMEGHPRMTNILPATY